MIIGDLDAELVMAARAVAGLWSDALPASASSWRPAPDGDPARYSTSLSFELARRTARRPAELAAGLAAALAHVHWIGAAVPAGAGYLTITVTGPKLAEVADRIVAAGPACARSDALRGTFAAIRPWPDPAAGQSWRQAWQEQADAMAGRLAAAAGASISERSEREHGAHEELAGKGAQSPVAAAVAFCGADAVRYRLARTLPGRVSQLGMTPSGRASQLARPEEQCGYSGVRLACAEAASTLRWAAELEIDREQPSAVLDSRTERDLLGLLSWFPIRVASAARRRRAAEVPHYLEDVAAAWMACRLASPALPFGGLAAPREPAMAAARLQLAEAVRTVLSAGLAMTGIAPPARI